MSKIYYKLVNSDEVLLGYLTLPASNCTCVLKLIKASIFYQECKKISKHDVPPDYINYLERGNSKGTTVLLTDKTLEQYPSIHLYDCESNYDKR